jgi:hypothetical protein
MPSLLQRFARITPYFRHSRLAVGVAFLASLLGALTEPLIPACSSRCSTRASPAARCRCGWCRWP